MKTLQRETCPREAVLQTFSPTAAGRKAAEDYARMRPEFCPCVVYAVDGMTGEGYWEVMGEAVR